MKSAFDGNCVDICCSREVTIEQVGTCDQRIVPSLSGSVATGAIHLFHRSNDDTYDDDDDDDDDDDVNNHNDLERQHILNNDKNNKSIEHKTSPNAFESPLTPIGADVTITSTPRRRRHSCIDPSCPKVIESWFNIQATTTIDEQKTTAVEASLKQPCNDISN